MLQLVLPSPLCREAAHGPLRPPAN